MKRVESHKSCASGHSLKRKTFSCLMRMFCCGLLAACAGVAMAQAQDNSSSAPHKHVQHKEHPPKAESLPQKLARPVVPDVEVLDQNGRKLKFYTDLIKGKLLVINFVYTSCQTYCPQATANLARLQAMLGDRLGRDVYLLSISTDPVTDSPRKLKSWSERFKPQAGWTFVTGEMAAMQILLQTLTGDGPQRGYHIPLALVVNDGQGIWRSTYGMDSPGNLIKMLDELTVKSKP